MGSARAEGPNMSFHALVTVALQQWSRPVFRLYGSASRRQQYRRGTHKCVLYFLLLLPVSAVAQVSPGPSVTADPSAAPEPNERWNLFYQATSIGDEHGSFPALYSGPLACRTVP